MRWQPALWRGRGAIVIALRRKRGIVAEAVMPERSAMGDPCLTLGQCLMHKAELRWVCT